MSALRRPVTVMYVAAATHIGGGNRVLMDVIDRLDRSRFTPMLVAPATGPLTDWASAHGVVHRVIADHRPASRWGVGRRVISLAAAMLRFKADIVHAASPMCYRDASLAARLTGVARVCHLGYPPDPGELEWTLRVPPRAVIACHELQALEVRDAVRATAPTARLIAVPNGVDPERFAPSGGDTATSVAGARPIVLIVGHLSEVKGHPAFFDAAARVVAAGEDVDFVALGGETVCPGYRAVLEARVARLGIADRVRFLGWQPDVAGVLRSAAVVVLPSLAEGLPMAILEAMACGSPLIATPVGGVPEAISHEVTGLLVPAGEVEPLADAIVRLLRDRTLAATLGQQARQRVLERFSVRRMVAEIEAIYEDAAPVRLAVPANPRAVAAGES